MDIVETNFLWNGKSCKSGKGYNLQRLHTLLRIVASLADCLLFVNFYSLRE